jgi:hypothetical protein
MGKARKKEAYVVFQGRNPGIYSSWADCDKQVNGFKGQRQRGYENRRDAEKAWDEWTRAKASEVPHATEPSTAQQRQDFVHTGPYDASNRGFDIEAQKCTLKRSNPYIVDLIGSDDEEQPASKKVKSGADDLEINANFVSFDLEDKDEDEVLGSESPIRLTAAQQAVVEMALKGDNIFVTGAAGSGKTATLKEILRLLKKRFPDGSKHPSVQVVAPTGIAALPLDGKTTYSFAGW